MKKVIGFILFAAIILTSCGRQTPSYEIKDIKKAGDGYVIVVCHECKGNKYVQCVCNNGKIVCPDCNGEASNYPCSKCNGEGMITCSICEGEAYIDCTVCDGKGEIRYDVPKNGM